MPELYSVTARYSKAIVAAMERQGMQLPADLRLAMASAARVPMAQQDALWSLFAQGAADPLAPLRLGQELQAGHLDVLGMLLLSCDTLGDALEVLTEYAPIVGDNARFEVGPAGQGFLELRYLPEYAACVEQRVEAALSCVVALTRWMTQGQFQAQAVHFRHAPRTPEQSYVDVLGCPVRFGQTFNAVVMNASDRALGLMEAGTAMHAHLRTLADSMLESLVQGSVSAQVRQLTREHPRWGKERMADQLGMSGRNLNRKLAADGISFKALHEAVLYDMARQSLRAGQSVQEVSERLGFSDDNAFTRAFRRWSGVTPAQFSKQQSP